MTVADLWALGAEISLAYGMADDFSPVLSRARALAEVRVYLDRHGITDVDADDAVWLAERLRQDRLESWQAAFSSAFLSAVDDPRFDEYADESASDPWQASWTCGNDDIFWDRRDRCLDPARCGRIWWRLCRSEIHRLLDEAEARAE